MIVEKASIQKDYSFLQTMSTEDLNKLLQEDMELKQDESDMDLIVKVLEVLEEREKESADSDMETALNQLHDKIDLYERMFAGIDDSDVTVDTHSKAARQRLSWYRIVGIAAVIVLRIAIGVSTASAMGYDLWGGVVHWTKETFGFGEKESAFTADEKYHNLETILIGNGVTIPVLPKWLPEQYSFEDVMVFEDQEVLRIVAMAYAEENTVFFQVIRYSNASNSNRLFEINGDSVQKYEACGIVHYIMNNEDSLQIIWARENYQIQMDFSDSSIDTIKIIDSIYKEK